METLGIILARAGSKGLPHKCAVPLLGRPLIDYTFDHALAATRLGRLVLSSDSDTALALAAARQIETVRRPPELATDTATIDAAARHAVLTIELKQRVAFDAVVILYANVPVRAVGVIDRCVELLITSGADSVRTLAPVGKHHPDWLQRAADDGTLVPYRTNSIHRRQDLEPLYYHDGAVLVVRRSSLFGPDTAHDAQAFWGQNRRGLIQRPEDAVDIDTPLDLRIAEALLLERAESAVV